MKLMILTHLCLLLVISSCSSGNHESMKIGALSDPVLPENGAAQGSMLEIEPEHSTVLITMDNHIDIVMNVLAIFSGKLYGDELLSAPNYSDVTYERWPEVDPDTAELVTQAADIVCDNGGTVSVIPETEGFFVDNQLTWHFDFDRCQDGISLLDGQISRAIYESITITSDGFEYDDQVKVVRFSGSLTGRSGSGHYWVSTGVNFSLDNGSRFLFLEDSTTAFFPDELAGEFLVQADWTGGQTISVRTLNDWVPSNDTGKLEISAGPNNRLLLDAETGNIDSVKVTITTNGVSDIVTQSWKLWSDSLIFNSVSGY